MGEFSVDVIATSEANNLRVSNSMCIEEIAFFKEIDQFIQNHVLKIRQGHREFVSRMPVLGFRVDWQGIANQIEIEQGFLLVPSQSVHTADLSLHKANV